MGVRGDDAMRSEAFDDGKERMDVLVGQVSEMLQDELSIGHGSERTSMARARSTSNLDRVLPKLEPQRFPL